MMITTVFRNLTDISPLLIRLCMTCNYFYERDKNNTALYTTLLFLTQSFNLTLTPEVFKLIFSEVN